MLCLKRLPGQSVILFAENLFLEIKYIGRKKITINGDSRHGDYHTEVLEVEVWTEHKRIFYVSGKDFKFDFYYKDVHITYEIAWSQLGYVNMRFDTDSEVRILRKEVYEKMQANSLSVKN